MSDKIELYDWVQPGKPNTDCLKICSDDTQKPAVCPHREGMVAELYADGQAMVLFEFPGNKTVSYLVRICDLEIGRLRA